MKEKNIYRNPELGFSIEKPHDWVFMPSSWVLNLKDKADPFYRELDERIRYARLPFVYFHYDHGISDIVIPTVQVMYRTTHGTSALDRSTILGMQLVQLQVVLEDYCLVEATSDGVISERPANIIKSTHTVNNQNGQAMDCLSRCYVIFTEGAMFVVVMSGPVEGSYRCDREFGEILRSIRIG